ncbi:MAG: bifunctional diguanylate cyclase/phosphodiesterase [Gammaproteobacteria bacterium]
MHEPMQGAEQRNVERPAAYHRHWLLSAAVLVFGLVVTAWYVRNDIRRERQFVEASFNAAAERVAINIEHRLRELQVMMRGVQGYFAAADTLDREAFGAYVDSLHIADNLPGVPGVGFAQLIAPDEIEAHVQRQRAEVDPAYRITPPGARSRYAPIVLIEPLEANRAALGFDVFANEEASAATARTLASNDAAITARTSLVQDAGREDAYGFVMYLPVYRRGATVDTQAAREAAIVGWVDVPFRMNELMEGMRGEVHPDIYFEIHDGAPGTNSLLYRSSHASGQDAIDPSFASMQRALEIGGREWTLLTNATPEYLRSINVRSQGTLIAANGTLLSLLAALAVWLMARAHHSAEHRFARVFDNAGEGVLLFDAQYRVLDANALAEKLFGYSKRELRNKSLPALVGLDAPELDAQLAQAVPGSAWLAEWDCRTRDGGSFPAQVSIGRVDARQSFAVLRDMTGRRKHEQRILRLTHLYKALSATSHSILRRTQPDELFALVCRIAVEHGGMALAWVGQEEAGTDRIVPLAVAGAPLDVLAGLDISMRADVAEGRGPTGTALREDRSVIVHDYSSEPEPRPWHMLAREHGWCSAGCFPIRRGGQPVAVLTVYHAQVDAFDAEAIALLEEMTNDIGFALDTFDLERERQHAAHALAENEAKMSAILENVGACIYLKDAEGRYLYANRELLELLGVADIGMLYSRCEELFEPEGLARVYANDARVFRTGETLQCEETVTMKSTGVTYTYLSVKLPLRRADGSIYALCGISTDITGQKVKDERIAFLSNYDMLTMLPNRELLRDRAQLALATAQKAKGRVALLSIDLDRFKIINESLGPSVGDALLQDFAQRLKALTLPHHTLCRPGGDEFQLLMPGTSADGAAQMASRLLDAATQPFMLRQQRVVVTASVGIALFPDDARDFEQLARNADAALFRAKKSGAGSLRFFTRQMHEQSSEVLKVESELRQAIELDQLRVYYQPQIDIATRRIIGAEALLRWQHPQRGLLTPGSFIPIAEESGLIVEIGAWVLRTAIRQCKAWEVEGFAPVTVAVNLSAIQFRRSDFYRTVVDALEAADLAPQLLELEFTEGIALENSEYTLDMMTRLRRLGVALSIDDFGVGYSALGYVKHYPLNTLKIDQSFVRGLGQQGGDDAIVNSIIVLAQSLGFKTLAEGVENEAQLAHLERSGCNAVQGYLFSRAVPPERFAELLRNNDTTDWWLQAFAPLPPEEA